MAEDNFDPYYKWLGISARDQPPHHYRLLGIPPFESDRDVISNAADQRMAHLRRFQTGPLAPLAQQLLNEVAAASACLMSRDKQAVYDAELKKRLNPTAHARPAEPRPPQVAAPPAVPDAALLVDSTLDATTEFLAPPLPSSSLPASSLPSNPLPATPLARASAAPGVVPPRPYSIAAAAARQRQVRTIGLIAAAVVGLSLLGVALYFIAGLFSGGNAMVSGKPATPGTNSNNRGQTPPQSVLELSTGLVGHWTFDEGQGRTAKSSVGQSHGTFVGNPVWVDGRLGKSLKFDGVDDGIDCGERPAMKTFTFAAFINMPSPSQENTCVVATLRSKTNNRAETFCYYAMRGEKTIYTRPQPEMACEREVSRPLIKYRLIGAGWQHVAESFDGSTLKCYLSGRLLSSTRARPPDAEPREALRIGFSPLTVNGAHFRGLIDDVRLYERALSDAEIAALAAGKQ